MENKTQSLFDDFCRVNRFKEATCDNYRFIIRSAEQLLAKDFLQFTSEDAKKYASHLLSLVEEEKLSPYTLRVRLYCCDKFDSFLFSSGSREDAAFALVKKPVTDSVPMAKNIPTLEECDRLLTAAVDMTGNMHLILSMVLRMGLSLSDIISLKRASVFTMDDNVYLFYPGRVASENRYLPVPSDLKDPIREHLDSSDAEYFFVNRDKEPLTRPSLDKRFRQLRQKADVADISIKDLRNRAIFQMLHDGAEPFEVANYVGLSMRRINTYLQSPVMTGAMLNMNPTEMSSIRII